MLHPRMHTMTINAGCATSPGTSLVADIYAVLVNLVVSEENPELTLHHLSLTCRILRPLCQRHMFADVKIDYQHAVASRGTSGPMRTLSFLKMIRVSPDLNSCLETLRFTLYSSCIRALISPPFCGKGHMDQAGCPLRCLGGGAVYLIVSAPLTCRP